MKPAKAPELLHAPHWDKSMGREPYYYQDKPVGNRCLWAIRWVVAFDGTDTTYPNRSTVMVTIKDWERIGWTLENMTDEQIRCELEDVSARPNEFASKAVQLLLDSYPDKANWRWMAENLLMQARQGYPEAIAPFHPPTTALQGIILRPGWETFDDDKKAPPVSGLRLGKKR